MNPESPLFHQHNINRIANNVYEKGEKQKLANDLSEILQIPDAVESVAIASMRIEADDILAERDSFPMLLNKALTREEDCKLSPGPGLHQPPAKAKLFEPHDKTTSSQFPEVELKTSAVGFDLFERGTPQKEGTPVSQMLLFKLDHIENPETAKDLQLDVNCKFGVNIQHGELEPFILEMMNNERAEHPLERRSPMEDDDKRLKIRFLDREKDADEYVAVMDEAKLFVQQRQADQEQ